LPSPKHLRGIEPDFEVPQLSGIEKAQEIRLQRAAEKALDDPIRLRMAARIVRTAKQRGLVGDDDHPVEQEAS